MSKNDIKLLSTINELGSIVQHDQVQEKSITPLKKFIKGKSGAEGYAYANIYILDVDRTFITLEKKEYTGHYFIHDFYQAVKVTSEQLENLQKEVGNKLSDNTSLIFTAHLLMLKDKSFTGAMVDLINEGEQPPYAILKIGKKYIDIFGKSTNLYIKEKVQDIEDLIIRLIGNLTKETLSLNNLEGRIIIAQELFPSDILKLSSENISGIILVSGGVTSHLSILTRSLKIPMVIAEEPDLLTLDENTKILLDADVGNIYLNPDQGIIDTYKKQNEDRQKIEKQKYLMKPKTKTKDGENIKLMVNINLLSDLKVANELYSEGIGLYRTEFPFIIRNSFPSEEEQYVVYRKLIELMPGKEITFRTLDIGGDKVLPYYHFTKENNPFLGMRSIRFSLQNKDIFKQQISAMLRAGHNADIKIMFPMISSLEELLMAKKIVNECIDELKQKKYLFNTNPKIGIMAELPSIVEIINELAEQIDFLSIGTNDFIQYMLAVDRTNEKVADLYLPCHPAVLRALKKIVDGGISHNIEVSICGEMASQELYIPFLLGIGIRVFSLDPVYLPKIQRKIAEVDLTQAKQTAELILKESTVEKISKLLNES